MKRIALILCLILVLSGCQSGWGEADQVASDHMDAALPANVVDMLAAYPSGYHETCNRTDLVVMDQGGSVINDNLWNDFYAKVQSGEPAEIVIAYFTTEGDPILNYVSFDGAAFFYVSDNSRDMYGAEPHYESQTFTCLQSFMNGRSEMFVLSNVTLEDLEAYEEYCQSQPEPYPVTLLRILRHSGELRLEDICDDSAISPEEIEAALASASGMEWTEYETMLSAAIESGDYSKVAVSLDGRMGYYVIHHSPDGSRVRAIRFPLLDDDPDAEGWLRYTETIHGILSDTCTEKQSSTNYNFSGGKIHLEHGPVNSEDYTVHDDGTASYSGVIGVLGDRILEFRFTFEE